MIHQIKSLVARTFNCTQLDYKQLYFLVAMCILSTNLTFAK